MKSRIGVYVCHCGSNIADVVQVEQVRNFARSLPEVVVSRDYSYMCSSPGQNLIKKDILEQKLNKVIVAACSPRLHEHTFRQTLREAGLNPYCLEIANLREQCSWVHHNRQKATEKAQKLVEAAVAKALRLSPLKEKWAKVTPAALVIGGGIAGMQAALDIAEAGFEVYLVEQAPSLGGHMAQLDKTFPTLDCSSCILTPKMVDVQRHPQIHLLTYSEIEEVQGYVGNFKVRIKRKPRYVDEQRCVGCGLCAEACRMKGKVSSQFNAGMGKRSAIYVPFAQAVPLIYAVDPESCLFLQRGKCGRFPACQEACSTEAIDFGQKEEYVEAEVGAIVVATGFQTFAPELKPEYAYQTYNNVITGLEFERLSSASGPTGGRIIVNGQEPREVVFIHCVGSRDRTVGNEYCSRVCCMYTAKQAHLVKENLPEARITVFYTDMRAFGKGFEEFYDRVREKGVRYIRGNASEIYKQGNKLVVRGENTLLSRPVEVKADLVVLAVGLVPHPSTKQIAHQLHLSFSPDGFLLEAHPKLRPVETSSPGIYLAGCCQGPKDIPDTVAQAKAAASSVIGLVSKGKIQLQATTAYVDPEICTGCGICISVCPYDARQIDERRKIATVTEAACEGCGACVSACPNGASQQYNFSQGQVISTLEAIL